MKIEKTGYNCHTRKAREISAFIFDAEGYTVDVIFPGQGNHKTALEWAEWRAPRIPAEYPTAVKMAVHCDNVEIAVITFDEPTTETPETIAPDFDALSHAAQNVALNVDNDGEIYRKMLRPLTEQVTRRFIKGAPVELRHLAECSTMAKITLAGVRECRRWDIHPTKDDRRAAALYLAGQIIDTAREEAAR